MPAGSGGRAGVTGAGLAARGVRSSPSPGTIVAALEVLLLVVFALLPLALQDFWVIFVTRVLILALLALSFDLVWGFAGIMSFGQALCFGAAGYTVALLARDAGVTSIFLVLPAALAVGLVLAFLVASSLLLGRSEEHTSELQSLTKLVCRPLPAKNIQCPSAWSTSGEDGGNRRLTSMPYDTH